MHDTAYIFQFHIGIVEEVVYLPTVKCVAYRATADIDASVKTVTTVQYDLALSRRKVRSMVSPLRRAVVKMSLGVHNLCIQSYECSSMSSLPGQNCSKHAFDRMEAQHPGIVPVELLAGHEISFRISMWCDRECIRFAVV